MLGSLLRRSPRPDSGRTPDVPVNWGRLFSYMRPYLKWMAVAFVMILGTSALSLVFPLIIQQVIDAVLVENSGDLLNNITALLIGTFLLRAVLSAIDTYIINYIGEKIVYDLRVDLYNHMQSLSLSFFSKRRVGELVSRLTSDVTTLRNVLTTNVNLFVQQILIVIGSLVLMVLINWRLTLFIAVVTPIMAGLGVALGVILRRASTQIQDELAAANVVANETIQSIREVKSFVREDYERARYDGAVRRALDIALKVLRVRAVLGSAVTFVGFGSVGAILWFGGREALEGRLSGGELVAFLVYALSIAGSLGAILSLYTSLQQALGASKRVFEIMDTAPSITDAPDAQIVTRADGRITLAGVHFSYDVRQEVLDDITLDIAPGEIIALVGPSGAGKSTIFNLIPRFYDPTAGAVLLDGVDLRAITQYSLREQIAIVPQETLLFGGSVYDNIVYGKLDAPRDAVIEAARNANAHDFIMGLPDGYDTIVGERGIRLSGGQRQRVAIARALLKDPRILLLDEATSSLDSEAEHEVQEALGRLMQGRTTVIIAHRLSTVRIAHRIVVMQEGRIADVGSHDELIARGGLYARLHALQFRIEDALADMPDDPDA